VADRYGLLASRLARESLYSFCAYSLCADHVGEADRAIMAGPVRECDGRLPH
jgi:hypothetical protein